MEQIDEHSDQDESKHENLQSISKIFLWGSGKDGRLGNVMDNSEPIPNAVKTNDLFVQIDCGYHHSAGVTDEGEVLTWGRGVFGQLGHGNVQSYSVPQPVEALMSQVVTSVACGWQHTMALTQTGQVFSWGYGEDGQLGHSEAGDSLTPRLIQSLKNRVVSQIA